jgi:cell division transport system permease protein
VKLRTIGYFFAEAGRSLARNRLLTLATVSTVAACVLILGIALLLAVNAQAVMLSLESNVEVVAFLDKELTRDQEKEIGKELRLLDGVASVQYVSREQAIEELERKFGEGKYNLRQTLGGENPLPNCYRVKAADAHQVPALAKRIGKVPGVYKVRYGQGVVEKLFAATSWVRNLSVAVILLLAGAGVFLIATTIRLTIFSRRKELYLMKLVGATNWFIRWPLFIEGMTLGLTGALVATGLLAVGYYYLATSLTQAAAFIPLVTDADMLTRLGLGLLGAGAGLGLLGTYISVNRYLHV